MGDCRYFHNVSCFVHSEHDSVIAYSNAIKVTMAMQLRNAGRMGIICKGQHLRFDASRYGAG